MWRLEFMYICLVMQLALDKFGKNAYNNIMLDKMKKIFNGKKKTKAQKPLTEKEIATKEGVPYVKVLDTKVDADNPKQGYFELDWNKHFVTNLKEHGFSGNSDEEIVDATEDTPMDRNTDEIVKRTMREDGKTEIS